MYIVDGKHIDECKKCHLVRTREKIQISYDKYHRDEDYKKFEPVFENIFRRRQNLVFRNIKSQDAGKVLDIGTSIGTMLLFFKERQWETWGVEPSGNAEIAKKRGHKIINTTFEEADLPYNYFDVVIMNHTLEHVADPLKVLKKIHKLLKRGGIVLIDVPNFGSLSRIIMKGSWPYILPHEHTYHFTKTTLKNVMEKAGFSIIHSESRSGVFEFADPFKEIADALKTKKKRIIGEVLGLPGAFISTSLDMGTSMSVVGEKNE